MNLDTILDRVRSLCVGDPFLYVEAVSTETFAYDPARGDAAVFRVSGRGGVPRGGFGFSEECNDVVDVEVRRPVPGDYRVTRRALQREARSLTAAVTRDGATGGGDFAVVDAGRAHTVSGELGDSHLVLRLTLPVNYMSNL